MWLPQRTFALDNQRASDRADRSRPARPVRAPRPRLLSRAAEQAGRAAEEQNRDGIAFRRADYVIGKSTWATPAARWQIRRPSGFFVHRRTATAMTNGSSPRGRENPRFRRGRAPMDDCPQNCSWRSPNHIHQAVDGQARPAGPATTRGRIAPCLPGGHGAPRGGLRRAAGRRRARTPAPGEPPRQQPRSPCHSRVTPSGPGRTTATGARGRGGSPAPAMRRANPTDDNFARRSSGIRRGSAPHPGTTPSPTSHAAPPGRRPNAFHSSHTGLQRARNTSR